MNKPFLLGVTGGIGSGKSVVCKLLATMGIPAYDADSRAKSVMHTNVELKEKIIKNFGNQSYQDGKLNREYLSKTVFNDEQKLELLNTLVHPAVQQDFEQWVKENQEQPILAKEAALLFETGSYKQLDKTVLVSAPEALRIKRVLARDPQRSEEQVKAIIARQWPEMKKLALADFVVYNDETQPLIPQVLEVIESIKKAI